MFLAILVFFLCNNEIKSKGILRKRLSRVSEKMSQTVLRIVKISKVKGMTLCIIFFQDQMS